MKVILKEGFTYIPKWNDNRKEKKEDQIVVEFKFLSGLDGLGMVTNETLKDDEIKIGSKEYMNEYSTEEWKVICKSVSNFKDGDGNDIDKNIIPTQPGLAALYSECMTAFRAEAEVDKKK
ncbi:MAG: hypothetical protein GY797_36975 [Deltaproteobacteria bacterium]|nr:hypothetical protein [Deltaproteobacteria bacterium]